MEIEVGILESMTIAAAIIGGGILSRELTRVTEVTKGTSATRGMISEGYLLLVVSALALVILVVVVRTAAIDSVAVGKKDGHYYEVLISTPAVGGGTLVQARDLTDGNNIKTAVLLEYPPKGYVLDEGGGRSFLVPADVRVTTTKAGEYIFADGDEALIYSPSPAGSEK